MVLLKKVVEKFGIPQFIQFHERLHLSSILYIFSSIKKKQGKNKKDSHTSKNSEPLRVLTINFQSIKNKKPEVELIIESCKPSIIFGYQVVLMIHLYRMVVDSMCKGKVICCLHMIFLPTHFRSLFQGLNRYLLLWLHRLEYTSSHT
jgi:hypothetical protein